MEVKKTHVGAYGVIVLDDKIALIKKARGGYKGKLDLPGGGIEHEEIPDETLKRELMEEIGVNVNSFDLMDVTSVNIKWEMEPDLFEDLHHIGILYRVEVDSLNLKSDADGLDSEGANWYLINELNKNELSPFTIFALEKMGYSLSNDK